MGHDRRSVHGEIREVRECGVPLRIALGALIIKEKCGFTDEETGENIIENNCMQYFIEYHGYHAENPFAPSLMVEFRKRLDMAEILRIIDDTDEEGKRTGATGGDETGGNSAENQRDAAD